MLFQQLTFCFLWIIFLFMEVASGLLFYWLIPSQRRAAAEIRLPSTLSYQGKVTKIESESELTAVTLDSSLQVLSKPLCRTSLCWTRLCMAAVLEPLCSPSSWLADSSTVSRVCCHKTTVTPYCIPETNLQVERWACSAQGSTFSLCSCCSFSSCILSTLSFSHSLLSLVWCE